MNHLEEAHRAFLVEHALSRNASHTAHVERVNADHATRVAKSQQKHKYTMLAIHVVCLSIQLFAYAVNSWLN